MAQIHTPEDIIALLQRIEARSQQKASSQNFQEKKGNNWAGIGFRMGSRHLVIPLNESREVFPLPELITPVPKAQAWVYGIINLRGGLIPVIDLQLFLHDTPAKITKRSRIIVINSNNIVSSVLVDEVFGIKHFPHIADVSAGGSQTASSPYLKSSIVQQNIHWDVFSFHKLINNPLFMNTAA